MEDCTKQLLLSPPPVPGSIRGNAWCIPVSPAIVAGGDPAVWREQKIAAERRMRIIDAQPPAWKAILNDFPHQLVGTLAEQGCPPKAARKILENRFGRQPAFPYQQIWPVE